MPAGHQQVFDPPGQQGAERVVVVTAARDAVVEAHALHHVFLGHHILAFQQAGLAHAGLRGHVDDEAPLEAGQLAAHEVDQCVDVLAAHDFRARQVFDLEPVDAGHVRAVAPDHAGQGRLHPPDAPRAAQHALDLAIKLGIGLWFLALVALGRLGVHATQAEHGGGDVAVADVRRAGRSGDVQVAGGVDHHVRQDRLAAVLGFADDALDPVAVDQGLREPGMQA